MAAMSKNVYNEISGKVIDKKDDNLCFRWIWYHNSCNSWIVANDTRINDTPNFFKTTPISFFVWNLEVELGLFNYPTKVDA